MTTNDLDNQQLVQQRLMWLKLKVDEFAEAIVDLKAVAVQHQQEIDYLKQNGTGAHITSKKRNK